MISHFIVRITVLAVLLGVFTGSSRNQSVEPVGDLSGKTVDAKTPSTGAIEKKIKTASVPATSASEAITTTEYLDAVKKESLPIVAHVGRFPTLVEQTSGVGTPMIGSKVQSEIPARQLSSSSDWEFAFAPYLFMPAISGTVGARGRTLEVDASFGNVLEKLDLAVMGTLEARKGKFVFVSDLIWTKMSAERDTPGGLYSTAKVGVNQFVVDPEVGYRIAESKVGSFDVLGGVRIWSVESNLNLMTGTLPGFDVSQRKSWAAPVVGFRGLLNVSSKFFLSTKFDIGGAGIGADLTTQFYGGAGYRITPKIALIGGYRYLQVDYDDSEGFIFDTKMNGFVFGAKFSF